MSQASSTSRKALYIGGLDAAVTESTLRAAFIPFGPIQSIDMPMDYAAGTHKGYAFLEYVDGEDAAEAIYNMDGAELFGKTLVVNVAQADRLLAGNNDLTSAKQAVWSTDEWYREHAAGGDDGKNEEQENGKEKKILA
jgi:peptidyl-prolyl isomerase E (cyclophilin E)